MEKFLINGGNFLKGEIEVMGAKNAVLKALAASILFDKEPILIKNAPLIEDVFRMVELLERLGVKIERISERDFKVFGNLASSQILEPEISKSFRASIMLTGPLLARFGKVVFPHPGGCVIGERPIDIFLDGFEKLGAKVSQKDGNYILTAKKLKGAEIIFKKISVTATETLMMAAVFAKGKTILHNAACEPEIPALADFLNLSGAKITGAGTHAIIINGARNLRFKKPFMTIPDRIEAGSFAILAGLLGNPIKIKNCEPNHLLTFLLHLKSTRVSVETGKDFLKVQRADCLKGVDIKTKEYPGFATDLQAPFVALLTQAEGKSLIHETIFEGRLNYIQDLNRMGANIISCDPHRVIVEGPTLLRGREMESPDLRAGLAFLFAGLVAQGESIIHNIYQIDRGYEKIEERLQKLGVDIKRVEK